MFKKFTAMVCMGSLVLAGCASSSKNIASTYVSPIQYANYDCDQIRAEMIRLQGQVSQLGGTLDQAAKNDAALMGVTLLLFWPAAFALGGNKQQEAEYARLKGEYDALQQAGNQKKCMLTSSTSATETAK
jgi:hypothetical protein